MIGDAGSVVVLTGAGISVPSGIPDFRTPGEGLWHKVNPMDVAHIDVFLNDPARFWSFYRHRFQVLGEARPNRAHEIVAQWEHRGAVDAVITQNIDCLHRKAGSKEVVEVHGTIEHGCCYSCGRTYPSVEVERSFDSEGVPRCADCLGAIKPDVVLFGEMLPSDAIAAAHRLAGSADLLICIGSSLEVQPVASLPSMTLSAGGSVAIVTKGPTPYDHLAAVKLDGDVAAELEGVEELLAVAQSSG